MMVIANSAHLESNTTCERSLKILSKFTASFSPNPFRITRASPFGSMHCVRWAMPIHRAR